MGVLAEVVIDRHILDAFSIAGLLLGVLGSLYLANEFLRPHEVLRRLTKSLTSGLLGSSGFIVLYVLAVIFGRVPAPTLLFQVAGVWVVFLAIQEFLSNSTQLKSKPPLLLWKSVGKGAIFGMCLGYAVAFLAEYRFYGVQGLLISSSVLGIAIGSVLGSEDFISWWADHLSELRLGAIGVFLILFGFLFALAQPVVDILDLPVH